MVPPEQMEVIFFATDQQSSAFYRRKTRFKDQDPNYLAHQPCHEDLEHKISPEEKQGSLWVAKDISLQDFLVLDWHLR